MKIYNYDYEGLYIGEGEASPDPVVIGDYLIPARATTVPPAAEVLAGEKDGYWLGNSWSSVPKPVLEDEVIPDQLYKAMVKAKIDQEVTEAIVNGFVFGGVGGVSFQLTITDQHNLISEYSVLSIKALSGTLGKGEFPREVYTGLSLADGDPVMIGLGTLEEYGQLIDSMSQWIMDRRAEGIERKRTLLKLQGAELKQLVELNKLR
jgi:hypothetical protein